MRYLLLEEEATLFLRDVAIRQNLALFVPYRGCDREGWRHTRFMCFRLSIARSVLRRLVSPSDVKTGQRAGNRIFFGPLTYTHIHEKPCSHKYSKTYMNTFLVVVEGNGCGGQSSNPVRIYSHFT